MWIRSIRPEGFVALGVWDGVDVFFFCTFLLREKERNLFFSFFFGMSYKQTPNVGSSFSFASRFGRTFPEA